MKKCESLEEVREEIDKVDDQILELIAKRKDLVKQAANFKHSVEEIKADDRLDHVMDRIRHRALTLGVSPNLVAELYKKMIDEMVETEIAQFRNVTNF
ncbi:MAG TPA: chorismate mutase [Campylobacteraceae bacterium]|jgi:isochorismate pyruvate lyase|nr:chorismate mutase [Campylobacteraceae bacterium]